MSKQNESLDVNAKTIDEAIEQGLTKLGLTREQVDIEVIKEGKRGVFGIGSEEAQVRLTRRSQPVPEPEEPPVVVPPRPVTVTNLDEKTESLDLESPEEIAASAPPVNKGSQPLNVEEVAVRCLDGLLKRMDIKAEVMPRPGDDLVEPGEEPPLILDITGGDLGILIGRRSETLQALQFMVRVMVSKEVGSWQPLVVDVESYRMRRRQSLRQMAEKMAERAVISRKKVVLEAMPPHERRIIHIALRNHPQVITKSIGSEENRKVTIIPK